MARSFERAAIRVPGAPNLSGYLIRCSKCGEIEKISTNNRSGSMPPEGLAARFRSKGWTVGNREGSDICARCVNSEKNKKSLKQLATAYLEKQEATNVVQLIHQTITAEPPREMTREDRRLVFAKIDEVYLDEKQGYSTGWSDKKVAQDLGVPQAWVKSIREENFGVEGANEDFRQMLTDGQKLLDDFRVVEGIISDRIKEAQKTKDDLSARANHIAGRISQIEKLFK